MITEIRDQKIAIISDLHLGNPFSKAKQPVVHFLHWAARHGYDVVINGDGFEIAQVSFAKIARDVPEVFHAIKWFTSQDRTIYYVIGNHDIVMENFLSDWGGFKMAPFLNVWSGEKRIRVEHGHLYDPFFVKSPNVYEFVTWLAGFALQIHPSLYKLWIAFEKFQSRFSLKRRGSGIAGEHSNFFEAATELARRGFDDVVFGHTHHAGSCVLNSADPAANDSSNMPSVANVSGTGRYYNSGSWLIGTPFIEIVDGQVQLRTWTKELKPLSPARSSLVA